MVTVFREFGVQKSERKRQSYWSLPCFSCSRMIFPSSSSLVPGDKDSSSCGGSLNQPHLLYRLKGCALMYKNRFNFIMLL